MDDRIKYLKLSLLIEMILGLVLTSLFAASLGASTVAPSFAAGSDYIIGGSYGFVVIFLPVIFFPLLALKELNTFKNRRKLTFNLINSAVVVTLVFFPLSVWQIYMLYKLRSDESDYTPHDFGI